MCTSCWKPRESMFVSRSYPGSAMSTRRTSPIFCVQLSSSFPLEPRRSRGLNEEFNAHIKVGGQLFREFLADGAATSENIAEVALVYNTLLCKLVLAYFTLLHQEGQHFSRTYGWLLKLWLVVVFPGVCIIRE